MGYVDSCPKMSYGVLQPWTLCLGHVGTSWDVLRYNEKLGTWDLCCVQCGT